MKRLNNSRKPFYKSKKIRTSETLNIIIFFFSLVNSKSWIYRLLVTGNTLGATITSEARLLNSYARVTEKTTRQLYIFFFCFYCPCWRKGFLRLWSYAAGSLRRYHENAMVFSIAKRWRKRAKRGTDVCMCSLWSIETS